MTRLYWIIIALCILSVSCRISVMPVVVTPTVYEYRYIPPTSSPSMEESGAPEVTETKWMP